VQLDCRTAEQADGRLSQGRDLDVLDSTNNHTASRSGYVMAMLIMSRCAA
jgi:hypothetical protein